MSGSRIAILARLDPKATGGSRSQRMARVLAGAGHDVTLIVLGDGEPESEECGYRLLRPRRTAPPVGPLGYLSEDPQLGEAAVALSPDLVIATDPPTLEQAVEVASRDGARDSRTRVVYDSWELYPDQVEQTVPRRWFRPLLVAALRRRVLAAERRCLPRTAGVILTSEGHERIFRARHRRRLPAEVALVRNVPPFEEARPDPHLRRELGAEPGDRVLVYAGSLGPSRGLFPLLEAARRLGEGHRLAIVGFGWLAEELARRAPGNARVLPRVPVERLVSVLAGADVGVLPIEPNNLSKRHSLANKLFEYLMAGLPVLATDLPEHRAVLDGSGAGALVPSATPEHLVRGAEEIFAEEARDPGGQRGAALRLARERFNLEAEAPALLSLVRRCLVGSSR